MQHQGTGLPGLTGVDHVGLTVPDLEKATSFLVDVLGCEYLYSLGPFVDDGDWMQTHRISNNAWRVKHSFKILNHDENYRDPQRMGPVAVLGSGNKDCRDPAEHNPDIWDHR